MIATSILGEKRAELVRRQLPFSLTEERYGMFREQGMTRSQVDHAVEALVELGEATVEAIGNLLMVWPREGA